MKANNKNLKLNISRGFMVFFVMCASRDMS